MRYLSTYGILPGLLACALLAPSFVRAADRFECGRYEVRGLLHRTAGGFEVLDVLPGTRARYSLVLLDVDAEQAIVSDGRTVVVPVEVDVPGVSEHARVRVAGPVRGVTRTEVFGKPVSSLSKAPCRGG